MILGWVAPGPQRLHLFRECSHLNTVTNAVAVNSAGDPAMRLCVSCILRLRRHEKIAASRGETVTQW